MSFEELRADITDARSRATKAGYLDPKKELSNNLYPLLLNIVDVLEERVEGMQELVDTVVGEEDSFIKDPLSKQIYAVFALGEAMAQEIEKLVAVPEIDDIKRKSLLELISTYRGALTEASTAIEEVTVVDADEEGEEGGDEEEEEEDADADGDSGDDE